MSKRKGTPARKGKVASEPGAAVTVRAPTNCGEAYKVLVSHYGTDDLGELSRLSAVSRSTLAYWRSCPGARMRKNGRQHFQRIFAGGGDGEHSMDYRTRDPSLEALLEMFQEVRDILIRIEQKFIDRFS